MHWPDPFFIIFFKSFKLYWSMLCDTEINFIFLNSIQVLLYLIHRWHFVKLSAYKLGYLCIKLCSSKLGFFSVYFIVLSLDPVIGAISAGNAVVLKPSEIAPATSSLLSSLLEKYLDNSAIRVVEGAVEETTALLEQKWDKILYTGFLSFTNFVWHPKMLKQW